MDRQEPLDVQFDAAAFAADTRVRWEFASTCRRRISGVGVYLVETRRQVDYEQAVANQYLAVALKVGGKTWLESPLHSARRLMRAIPVEEGQVVEVVVSYCGPEELREAIAPTQVVLVEDGRLLTEDDIADGKPVRV